MEMELQRKCSQARGFQEMEAEKEERMERMEWMSWWMRREAVEESDWMRGDFDALWAFDAEPHRNSTKPTLPQRT